MSPRTPGMGERFRGIDRIHFVGVGGSGMSGLAELLAAQGFAVSGSDLADGPVLERLRGLGVRIALGHAAHQAADADVVVVSSAIRADNPEVREAAARGIPVIPRAEMLAELMRLQDGVAVAGTHGKTTTTSLVAHVLESAGQDPTAVVGGRVELGGRERSGARLGSGSVLVAEADESDGSFLRLAPVIAVVTNVEPEHLDHWQDADALSQAFIDFANGVPFFGRAIVCVDDPGVQAILPRLTRRTVRYGFSPQADWVARSVSADPGGMTFEVAHEGTVLGRVQLPLPGRHNVQNALATLAVVHELGVSFDQAARGLEAFAGVERRFETIGRSRGVWIVDDYGHHPTEIRATLAAARGLHDGRVVVVFQPHRYSRTRDLLDAFGAAFHDADQVVLTAIYGAGEDKIPGIDAEAVAQAIRARGHRDVRLIADLSEIPDALAPTLREGDLVLTLGAGSVGRLGPRLLAALAATS